LTASAISQALACVPLISQALSDSLALWEAYSAIAFGAITVPTSPAVGTCDILSGYIANANVAVQSDSTPTFKGARQNIIVANIQTAQAGVNGTGAGFAETIIDMNQQAAFDGGNDGDIDWSLPMATRQAAIDALLVDAYTGLIDPSILSRSNIPIDIVLDANYDMPVKLAIVNLVTNTSRGDFPAVIDTGINATIADSLNVRGQLAGVNTYMVAIYTQGANVHDNFTAQDINVTPTYFLAQKMPQYDPSQPLAGPKRGVVTGFNSISYNPNDDQMEQLYRAKMNYLQTDPKRTMFGSQITSQSAVTALSSFNNVRTLLAIRSDIEDLARSFFFEFNNTTVLAQFQQQLSAIINGYVNNGALATGTGQVSSSAYDQTQNLVRVSANVSFSGLIEHVAIEIVVAN
jgi:hypothetical protein